MVQGQGVRGPEASQGVDGARGVALLVREDRIVLQRHRGLLEVTRGWDLDGVEGHVPLPGHEGFT